MLDTHELREYSSRNLEQMEGYYILSVLNNIKVVV